MHVLNFDPVHAFHIADKYRTAVGVLNMFPNVGVEITKNLDLGIPDLPYPKLVLATFGTEIFLKSILKMINCPVENHHDNCRHFLNIKPESHRESIQEYYRDVLREYEEKVSDSSSKVISRTIDEALKSTSNLFNILRFIYEEGKKLPEDCVLNQGLVMEAVRRYAIELFVLNGRVYFLRAAAREINGKYELEEGGRRIPLNKNTPDLRSHLKEVFGRYFEGDPFVVTDLDLNILRGTSPEKNRGK